MSRTTTNLEMGRPKTCYTKVKLCKWLGEKFWQSYFGAVMTSSKSRKTAKNQKNRDFIDFSQLQGLVYLRSGLRSRIFP